MEIPFIFDVEIFKIIYKQCNSFLKLELKIFTYAGLWWYTPLIRETLFQNTHPPTHACFPCMYVYGRGREKEITGQNPEL